MRRTLTGAVDGPRTTWFASRSLGSDDPPGPNCQSLPKARSKPANHAIVLGKVYFRLLRELAPVLEGGHGPVVLKRG